MNRFDLQRLSVQRKREARALLAGGYSSGAYYFAGYAVECALKARIASTFHEFDFPDKKTVNDSYTHNLEFLIRTAGLEPALVRDCRANPQFARNWAVVK